MKKFMIFLAAILIFSVSGKTQLPIAVDYSEEMPVPWNQGYSSGACVAFAGAYMMTWLEAKEMGWNINLPEHQFSPAFLYNLFHVPGTNPGISPGDCMRFICQEGCITLDKFPYNEFDDTTRPNDELRYQALAFREKKYSFFYDQFIAKEKLINSPIITGILYDNYVHCVCVVGYNDTIQLGNNIGGFKYINSYGPTWSGDGITAWGENGFGWLPYEKPNQGFYLIENKINRIPKLAFKFKKGNHSLNSEYYYLCDSEGDTIDEQFLSLPATDVYEEFFLAIDTFTGIADRLVIKITAPAVDSIINCSQYQSNNNFVSLNSINYYYADTVFLDSGIFYTLQKRNYEYQLLPSVMTSGKIDINNFGLKVSPNPFAEKTNFQINLSEESFNSIRIYDLAGRLVKNILENKKLQPGIHDFLFSENLSPGLYFAEFLINHQKKVIKIQRL